MNEWDDIPMLGTAQRRQEIKASHPPLASEKLAANNDELVQTTIGSQLVETGALKADAS